MGWKDAPLLEQPVQAQSQPQAWESAPEVEAPPTVAQRAAPSMGDVALNAIPKGLANLLNTPITLSNLIMSGIANLPMAGHLKGVQEAASNPIENYPMKAAEQMGLVDPAKEPQTGPQRVVDLAIQAAIGGAVVPGGGMASVVKGAAVGGASGALAQTTKELTGSDLLSAIVGMGTPFALRSLAQSSKKITLPPIQKATLQEAQKVGYVVEPSAVRQPTSKLETVAGKASIAQEASARNQVVTNRLAAKSLGLPEDTPLSPSVLDALKRRVAAPYEEVEQLRASATNLPWFPRYHSPSLIDELKQARQDKTSLYRQYYRNPDQGVLKAAQAAESLADSIEQDIDMIAKATGKPDLLPRLQAARQLYARIYDVEKALNVGSGNVSAPIIGRILDQGKPLSGELAVVGRFAQAFPRAAREIEGVPPSGVSGTDAAMSAVLGIGGAASTGNVAGAVAGGLPLLRGPARQRVLSEGYQRRLLREPTPAPSVNETAAQSGLVGKAVGQKAIEEQEE